MVLSQCKEDDLKCSTFLKQKEIANQVEVMFLNYLLGIRQSYFLTSQHLRKMGILASQDLDLDLDSS